MKLTGRDTGRITIDKLINITKIKVNKKKRFDSIEGCDEIIKEILNEYATRKHYVLLNELNKEVALQRNKGNLYKEQLDLAVNKIKELESELAKTDNSKALYREIDTLKEEVEILNKENRLLNLQKEDLKSKSKTLNLSFYEKTKIQMLSEYLSTVFLISGIIFSIVLTYKII